MLATHWETEAALIKYYVQLSMKQNTNSGSVIQRQEITPSHHTTLHRTTLHLSISLRSSGPC